MSPTQPTARDSHDLDFHDQIRAELFFVASALTVISTADIESHGAQVATLLDRLGDATTAVRDAVEVWYDGRPTAEEGGAAARASG